MNEPAQGVALAPDAARRPERTGVRPRIWVGGDDCGALVVRRLERAHEARVDRDEALEPEGERMRRVLCVSLVVG
jgi:hypothetical protein